MNPKKSKDRLYLFRRLGEAVDADRMMFMTEFELSHETDTDSEDTMMVVSQLMALLNQLQLRLRKWFMVILLQMK